MTEKKQGAAEWLRGIADWYEAEIDIGCRKTTELFGLCCDDFDTCKECRVKAMRAIADRIEAEPDELRDENERLRGMVREPQLPEGVEWPRFEDGELVKFGDEVEHEGETWKVTGVGFESPGFDIGLRCGLNIGAMSGDYGERLKRPTPKVLDADGAPIEVGDAVYLLEENGEPKAGGVPLTVISLDCQQQTALLRDVGSGVDRYGNYSEDFEVAEHLTHRKPDSWLQLSNDTRMGAVKYVDRILGVNIEETTTNEDYEAFARDIVRRAKALAKAGGVE